MHYIVDNVHKFPTEAWIFIPFPQASQQLMQSGDSEQNNASGVGISPHKTLAAANENPCIIPGVGILEQYGLARSDCVK